MFYLVILIITQVIINQADSNVSFGYINYYPGNY